MKVAFAWWESDGSIEGVRPPGYSKILFGRSVVQYSQLLGEVTVVVITFESGLSSLQRRSTRPEILLFEQIAAMAGPFPVTPDAEAPSIIEETMGCIE